VRLIIRLEKFYLTSPSGYKHICRLLNKLAAYLKIGVAAKRRIRTAVEMFLRPHQPKNNLTI
jgi:hypothetical protein